MVLYDLSEELNIWGYSSAGRALEWHSRGRGFESHYLHFRETLVNVGFFLYLQGFFFFSHTCAKGFSPPFPCLRSADTARRLSDFFGKTKA